MAVPARTQVFISYSHENAEWLKRLQIILRPLTRNQNLDVWDDTRIQWREEIRHALAMARVAVLLITPHFLASDFIANDELPPLLKAAEEGGLTILWVTVRHSLYAETDIAAYQAASNPARPLSALSASEQDEELVCCVAGRSAFAAGACGVPIMAGRPVRFGQGPRISGGGAPSF